MKLYMKETLKTITALIQLHFILEFASTHIVPTDSSVLHLKLRSKNLTSVSAVSSLNSSTMVLEGDLASSASISEVLFLG